MNTAVISGTVETGDETNTVNNMLEQGLRVFHLRKPEYSKARLAEYIESIRQEYCPRIILHSHYSLAKELNLGGIHITRSHKKELSDIISSFRYDGCWKGSISISFHSLKELEHYNKEIDYVFLSPVFDSISKKGYKGVFDFGQLKNALKRTQYKVFALGGCCKENLEQVYETGFYGAAFLGAVWNSPDPLGSFCEIKHCARELKGSSLF